MKKYIPALMFLGLLIMPWSHRLLFENLRLALPDVTSDGAHWVVGIASAIAIWVTIAITT